MSAPLPVPKRPIKALGPGSLILGATGTDLNISAQVTAAKISWDVDAEDSMPVLSGGSIAGERNYTAKLEITAAPDLEADGVVDWSWRNKGTEQPVVFVPNEGEASEFRGTVLIDPIEYGGDVKKRNTSDWELEFIGEPTFTPDATGDTLITGG